MIINYTTLLTGYLITHFLIPI